jgi:mRNA interferase RelE/StbE
MYEIVFSQNAEKQLKQLDASVQERIINTLERIRVRPFHFIKRKQGTPYFIQRIGEYRAILNIKNNTLLIYAIEVGHRKNIYKGD